MSGKKAYRGPVQDWAGQTTFVNTQSALGIGIPEDPFAKGQSSNSWPVNDGKKEKERALPLPSDHAKNRDREIGPTYYNKNNYVPVRTVSVPGEQYGHPAKMDYGYPTRRKFSVQGDEGSTPYIRKTQDRQKNQRGVSKRKSQQDYLKDRARLKPLRRKYWRKKKRDPDTKRKRKYYQAYKDTRYKRKGKSPYMTPAERSKAWRRDQKKAEGPTEGLLFLKKTEPPKGTTTTSLRAPNLSQNPQPGLFRDISRPNVDALDVKIDDHSNGSGKVLPQSWSGSQMSNRMAYRVARAYLARK